MSSRPKASPKASDGPNKHRLETLTDGVFAIAMTLLAFDLHVQPFQGVVTASQLSAALLRQWPSVSAVALSFLVLGQFWVTIHNRFRWIKQTDHVLTWLNIAYLLFIALVPFTADHLGRYAPLGPVVILYGLNLFAVSALDLAMWSWATRSQRLVDSVIDAAVVRQETRLALSSTVIYAVAALTGTVAPIVGIALFVGVPLWSMTGVADRGRTSTDRSHAAGRGRRRR